MFFLTGGLDSRNDEPGYRDTRVIIRAIVDKSPAYSMRERLRVGDWIRSVDGQQVCITYVE